MGFFKKCIKIRTPLLHVTWACFVKFRNIRDVLREKKVCMQHCFGMIFHSRNFQYYLMLINKKVTTWPWHGAIQNSKQAYSNIIFLLPICFVPYGTKGINRTSPSISCRSRNPLFFYSNLIPYFLNCCDRTRLKLFLNM